MNISYLGKVHTLKVSDCDNIKNISSLEKVHTLNLSNRNIIKVYTLENDSILEDD